MVFFHSCDGFGFCFLVGVFFFGEGSGAHLCCTSRTQAKSPSKGGAVGWMWWAGACSFVFRTRAEGLGMKINGNTFIAFQIESWDMAY